MTDTQEAMREEFDTWWMSPDGYVSMGGALYLSWKAWQAATAQSAEKIARLEKELATEKNISGTHFKKWIAAELSNNQLRDDLIYVLDIAKGIHKVEFPVIERRLNSLQPISTEALDAYVAEKLAEMQRTTEL